MSGSIHFPLLQRVLLQEQASPELQLERLFLSEIVNENLRKAGLI